MDEPLLKDDGPSEECRFFEHLIAAHTKVTTREFLAYCDPKVRRLFDYWDARCGEHAMPRRCDIDPADIPHHLPHLLLVDVKQAPPVFIYRLVGTEEVSMRGQDPTGQPVETHFFGPSREEVMACYHYVHERRGFLFDSSTYLSTEGRPSHEETLFLPLSDDGILVTQIMVYALPRHCRQTS